jgi:hypothetical protein
VEFLQSFDMPKINGFVPLSLYLMLWVDIWSLLRALGHKWAPRWIIKLS